MDGSSGLPAAMLVSLIPRVGSAAGITFSSSSSSKAGTFEITGVLPGSYFVLAGVTVIPVEVGKSDIDNLTITTTPGLTVKGQIGSDGVAPNRTPSVPGFQIVLSPLTSRIPAAYAEIVNGAFTFQNVAPGDYQVLINGSAGAYIKSIQLGNQDGLDGVHLDSQPEGRLDIVLSTRKGIVEGRVLDARREPIVNATVVVVPDPPFRQRRNMYYTPQTDASGKFHVDAIPGRYKVFAWEDVERNAWFDTEFVDRYESRGHPVTVMEGSSEVIDVPLIPYVP